MLGALGEQLELTDARVHLGAITRATQDVDVVALDQDGVLVSAEPLPAPLRAAAALVARDFGLNRTG